MLVPLAFPKRSSYPHTSLNVLTLTLPLLTRCPQVNQLDNRASNFYIALYWADFMAQADPAYKVRVTSLSALTVFVRCFCALYGALSQLFCVAVCACQLGNSYNVRSTI
jgi:hypothetical protein